MSKVHSPICRYCDSYSFVSKTCGVDFCLHGTRLTNHFSSTDFLERDKYLFALESKLRNYDKKKTENESLKKDVSILKAELYLADKDKYRFYKNSYDNLKADRLKFLEKLKKETKFIYIMMSGKYCKIGVTNDVEARRITIQTSNPLRVKIIKQKLVQRAFDHEKKLHSIYGSKRTSGEWFMFDDNDIAEASRYIDQINDDVMFLGLPSPDRAHNK